MTTYRTLARIDAALESWETGDDAAGWRADGGGPDELDDDLPYGSWVILDEFASVTITVTAAATGFVKELGTVLHVLDLLGRPRSHRRCRTCHPEAFSLPLAIDGHEYRRRSRARRRRRQ